MVKFIFKCSDNQNVEVEEIVAQNFEKMRTEVAEASRQIRTIEKLMEAIRVAISTIHLPDIMGESLDQIIKYYEGETELPSADKFLDNLNSKLLLDINMDTAQLGAKELFDLTSKKLMDIIQDDIRKGKSPVEISRRFNLTDGDVKKLVKLMKRFEVLCDLEKLIQMLEAVKNTRKH